MATRISNRITKPTSRTQGSTLARTRTRARANLANSNPDVEVPDSQDSTATLQSHPQPSPLPSSAFNSSSQGPVIPETRSRTPDDIIELRAQREMSRREAEERERVSLRRDIETQQARARDVVPGPVASAQQPSLLFPTSFRPHRPNSLYTEGMDPRFVSLMNEYPTIKPIWIKQISENTFDPINITKLCTDIDGVQTNSRYVKLGEGLEIATREEDGSLKDIKGIVHLIRCLGVYWMILLHFAHPGLQINLMRAFMAYQDHLLSLYAFYTWDSVRIFHLNFHKSRAFRGIDNPDGWKEMDHSLERHLVRKPSAYFAKPDDNSTAFKTSGEKIICKKYNYGKDCPVYCRFQHVCEKCGKQHRAMDCTNGKNQPSNPNSMPLPSRQ